VLLMEAQAILARAEAAELALSEFGALKRATLCVQASQTIIQWPSMFQITASAGMSSMHMIVRRPMRFMC
jgi:hypothetical protein